MKIKKEKSARRFMAFLAAVCMLSSMPDMSFVSYAGDMAGNLPQEQGIDGDILGEESETETEKRKNTDRNEAEESERTGTGDLEEGKVPEEESEGENNTDATDSEVPDKDSDTDKEENFDKDVEEDKEESDKNPDKDTDVDNDDPDKETDADNEEDFGQEDGADEETFDEDEAETEETDEEVTEEEEKEIEEETTEESIMLLSEEGDAAEDHVYTDANGVIYHYSICEDGTANIYELEDYRISYGDCKSLDIPAYMDGYAVSQLTFELELIAKTFPSVTIPETVTYMADGIFDRKLIYELHYNAEAAVSEMISPVGVFFWATIKELYIGENVKSIPKCCFAYAYITMDEFTLHVESIGERAFYCNKSITTLTISEDVKEIGAEAFADNDITYINYDAVSAVFKGSVGITSGVFALVAPGAVKIGENVKTIPADIFCGTKYTADTIDFPKGLTSIGAYAFYGSGMNIGELTISENIASIGQETFGACKIGVLNYNTVEAELKDVSARNNHRNPFRETEVGELRIGENVRVLPDALFYCIRLQQDTLVLPDSITYIGAYVLSRSNGYNLDRTSIGTLEIGENVTHIGRAAFGSITYDKMIIRAVEADTPPSTSQECDVPICKEVEIHANSAYYDFFTNKTEAENITLLCEDFETTYGEEYYDPEKGTFVTPVIDTCTVCGYEKSSEEYGEAYTVIFVDHDGRELSRQNVHKGEDAQAPEEPERTGYRFTGWNKDYTNITEDLTVTAEYEIRKFTVLFKDGDRVLSEQEVIYAGSATVPEDPTRPTEEWGVWRFTGWYGSYTNVQKDVIIQAKFEKVLNEYEVVFYDAEGNVLSRQKVEHGKAAEEPDAPRKESTEGEDYFFTGWSADTENITGNTSFYPVYDTTARTYTVKFMDGDIVLDTQTVEYGRDAEAPENPTRPAEEWGVWKFTGWSGGYTDVRGDVTVLAKFEKVVNEYEVIFYDAEGNALSRQKVEHGKAAEVPDAPEKESTEGENYLFTGWSGDTENITGDTAFYPVYDTVVRTYTITFMDGDAVLDRQTVAYGSDAVAPDAPSRPAEEWGSWKFTGWNGSYTAVKKNEIVRAVYERVVNEYEVIFYDAKDNILSRQKVAHGKAAQVPELPDREPSAQYEYFFTGWSGDTEHITVDMTFYPVYETKMRTYTVTFMDGEEILEIQNVEYGDDAKMPEDPVRPAEEWGSWKFTGWSGTYTMIVKDETVQAQFEKVINRYEVIFYDAEGNVLSRQRIAYGEDAKVPEIPDRKPSEQYEYEFTGWSAKTENITGDTAFYPVYDEKIRSYTVKFMDGDTVLDTQVVEYGGDAVAPSAPSRPAEEWGTWEFCRWNGTYIKIAKDETVYAQFRKIVNEYGVVFYDAEGNVLSRQKVAHGEAAQAPKAPEKEPTEKECYVFTGWDGDISNITKESSFHPVYEAKDRLYTVTFMNGTGVYDVQKVVYGAAAVTPADPVRGEDAAYTYKFIGWDRDFGCIKADMIVHAVFEQIVKPKPAEPDKEKPKDDKPDDTEKKPGTGGEEEEKPTGGTDEDKGGQPDGKPKGGSDGEHSVGEPESTDGDGSGENTPVQKVGIATGDNKSVSENVLRLEDEDDPSDMEIEIVAEFEGRSEEVTGKEKDNEIDIVSESEETECDIDSGFVSGMWLLWILLLLGIGLAAFLFWLLLFYFGKRTVCGTVRKADGCAVCGAEIVLEGQERLRTETDEDGSFCFSGLKKDSYGLCIFHDDSRMRVSVEIHMDADKEEEVFITVDSCCDKVKTKKEKRRYRVDVIV